MTIKNTYNLFPNHRSNVIYRIYLVYKAEQKLYPYNPMKKKNRDIYIKNTAVIS